METDQHTGRAVVGPDGLAPGPSDRRRWLALVAVCGVDALGAAQL
jgi:hypothetical protein